MFQKIKEYLALHPNSNLFSAVIFSITTMNTEQTVALLTAVGMVLSSVMGLVMQFLKWRQERIERAAKLEIEAQEKALQFERTKIENERLRLENRKFLSTFEGNQKLKKDET